MHSWVVDEEEQDVEDVSSRVLRKMPRQIVLDFHTEEWALKGMPGPGLYPIVPRARTWHLD
eukprot:8089921-Pyramimonas_sp.AAC.1